MEGSALLFECDPFPDGDFGFYRLYHHADEGGPGGSGDNSPAEQSGELEEKLSNPFKLIDIANKAFGFTPDYTLWGISNQVFNSMIMEAGYRSREANKLEDEHGEYEWIEHETLDGKIEKIKKYKNPKAV